MNFSVPSSMKQRRRLLMEMTPMIDVVFLLLVFFLVSTTQEPPESQLSPALQAERSESGAAMDYELQLVDIAVIDGVPGFRLGEQVFRSRDGLREVLRLLPKEQGIFVRGSDQVEAHWAASALQACEDAGFRRVTYVPAR